MTLSKRLRLTHGMARVLFAALTIALTAGLTAAQQTGSDAATAPAQSVVQDAAASAQEDAQEPAQASPPAVKAPSPDPDATAAAASISPGDVVPPGGNRVMGVLPNYRTASAAEEGTPITWQHKLNIARKDSFDYPLVMIASIFAGFSQLSNQSPSFGQGTKGFAHRLATNYADQAMGNMFTEGVFPALLHEDPRYFRRGTGSTGRRAAYALTRIFVTDTDSGHKRFNFSEWIGNASSVAISNAYYPDNRTFHDNATKLLTQCGTDALSQVLKEFWPDIRKKFLHKN